MNQTNNRTRASSGPTTPNHLLVDHDRYQKLIHDHFPAVSQKAVNQMKRALSRSSNRLWDEILWPNLLLDDQGKPAQVGEFAICREAALAQRPMYLPLAQDIFVLGRNHNMALVAAGYPSNIVQDEGCYFANHLRLGFENEPDNWEPPKERVVGSSHVFFTLEYDPPSEWEHTRRLKFLDTQLGWFRKSGSNDLDRPIRPVWNWATQFSDFRGMCANWSGHKSVHIHLVFETSDIMARCGNRRDDVRQAYIELWKILRDEVVRIFPQDCEPDDSLASPEQYRKVPNGRFTIGKSDHLLGIPEGTAVPLLCLWEKLLDRAPARANKAFINEGVLKKVEQTGRRKSLEPRRSRIGDMTPGEHRYCSEQFNYLIENLSGSGKWPRGAGLHKESVWIGRLFANEFDKNPSTIIFENGRDVFVQGGKEPNQRIALPLTLYFHIRKWRREYAAISGIAGSSSPHLVGEAARTQHPLEESFSTAATSQQEARNALVMVVGQALREHPCVLIRAGEGLGKTTTIANLLLPLSRDLSTSAAAALAVDDELGRCAEWERPSAFAFSSYELAKEKALEFAASASSGMFSAVVFPSFSRLYHECCDALGAAVLSTTEVAKKGHRSLVAAIRTDQPEVWSEMAIRHAALFAGKRGVKRTLYFLVHQVLQQAATNIVSAAFLHPDFFNSEPKDWWRLRDEISFQIAVHDEVPVEALVDMHRGDQVEWCADLFRTAPGVWENEEAGLAEKHRTFEAKLAQGAAQVDFAMALEIHRAEYGEGDRLEVAQCESYGSGLLYEGTNGRRWYARKRTWWRGLAQRTVLLTTEGLPTAMVRALDSAEQCQVLDLRTPHLRSGEIQLRVRASCSSKQANMIVDELRTELGRPGLVVITNRASSIDGAHTHAGVRGSNRFGGSDLAQTAFYKPPEEYERLQIINRLFGFGTSIRLRHVDEINQSAGRNLGFRHDGVALHHLVIGSSLYTEIDEVLHEECRYDLTFVEDASDRKRKNFSKARAGKRDLKQLQTETADLEEEFGRGA
jgi:hypothetical protein